MPASTHPHLPLVQVQQGKRRKKKRGLPGPPAGDLTKAILASPTAMNQHSLGLRNGVQRALGRQQVNSQNYPDLPTGIPFFLRVDPAAIDDSKWEAEGIELLAELDDGLIISFSQDTNLQELLAKIDALGRGDVKKMASVWEIIEADERQRRTLMCGAGLTDRLNQVGQADEISITIVIGTSGIRGGDIEAHDEGQDSHGYRRAGRRKKRIQQWRAIARERIQQLMAFVSSNQGRFLHEPDHPFLNDWAEIETQLPPATADLLAKELPAAYKISASSAHGNQPRRWKIRFPLPDLPPFPGGNPPRSEAGRARERELQRQAMEQRDEIVLRASNEVQRQLRVAGIRHDYDAWDFTEPDVSEPEPPQEICCVVILSKQGIEALLKAYPHLVYVEEVPPLICDAGDGVGSEALPDPIPGPPHEDAPTVGIIDSGIQEDHPLIKDAVLTTVSRSFLPGDADVADRVQPSGHGTLVAGAVLYPHPDHCLAQPDGRHPCWLLNLRVLSDDGYLHPGLCSTVATWATVHYGRRFGARIFNQSISADSPFDPQGHMDPWAAMIDLLSATEDVLMVVPTGNLPPGHIQQLLAAGHTYPAYLIQNAHRLASPAGAMHALVVGSLSYREWQSPPWQHIAGPNLPSAFARSGPGWFDEVKPDVVAFGGDFASDASNNVGHNHPLGPLLPHSTLYGRAAVSRSMSGSSFAAPQVAGIAAAIEASNPSLTAQTIRALIASSARWPAWAENDAMRHAEAIRLLGYGIPDQSRAIANDEHRVTMVSAPGIAVGVDQVHVYAVPVPAILRRSGVRVRIDVTLAYAGIPRMRRRHHRQYQHLYAEWRAAHQQEDLTDFSQRMDAESAGEPPNNAGSPLPWRIRPQRNHGIQGVRGSGGSLHKDWCVLDGRLLPEELGLTVIGRQGWERDLEVWIPEILAGKFQKFLPDVGGCRVLVLVQVVGRPSGGDLGDSV
ncbi:MAG: S8 family peptidase, partial [Planctomycetes bacterium]|nr:S8 family peptidase [Planctomycetota bacterium]